MPVNLAKIDGQIRRLQEIRRILIDPESARLLEQAIIVQRQNGTRRESRYQPAPQISSARAVWKYIAATPGQFTAATVARSLRASGIQVENSTVSRIISQLVRRGRVRVVQRGSGRKPNVCERVPIE